MELTRANAGNGYTVCATCRCPILPYANYWKGAQDYHDECRPEGAILNLTIRENVSVVSEGAA
jgi:hypothetical protein